MSGPPLTSGLEALQQHRRPCQSTLPSTGTALYLGRLVRSVAAPRSLLRLDSHHRDQVHPDVNPTRNVLSRSWWSILSTPQDSGSSSDHFLAPGHDPPLRIRQQTPIRARVKHRQVAHRFRNPRVLSSQHWGRGHEGTDTPCGGGLSMNCFVTSFYASKHTRDLYRRPSPISSRRKVDSRPSVSPPYGVLCHALSTR